jgi:hypothetical protein
MKFFDRIASSPKRYQLNRTRTSNINEYQLILGINWYKFEITKPKPILGVADPLIINSGAPV